MNKFLAFAALALALTTGFTCSKNTPEAEAPAATEMPADAAAEAQPTEGAAPAEGTPAEGTAPTE